MNVETVETRGHKRLVEALYTARKKSGLRQKEVAKKMGRSQTWIVRLESGSRRVDVIEFFKLARMYEVDPYKMLSRVIDLE